MSKLYQVVAVYILAIYGSTHYLGAIEQTGSHPQNAEITKSQDNEMVAQFVPPEDWRIAEANSLPKNVLLMVVGKGSKEFPPSINLAIDHYQGSLADYLKVVKSINDARGDQWQDLGTISTAAGKGSLSQLDTKMNWGDVRMLQVILIKDETVYILTAAALKEEFSKFYRDFFKSLSSLSISSKEKKT